MTTEIALDALERLVAADYSARHGQEWDHATLARRFSHCLDAGLQPRAARAVAVLAEHRAPSEATGDCFYCGGPGIRCCEHAPAR